MSAKSIYMHTYYIILQTVNQTHQHFATDIPRDKLLYTELVPFGDTIWNEGTSISSNFSYRNVVGIWVSYIHG